MAHRIDPANLPHPNSLNRRGFLQVGFASTVGLTLPQLLSASTGPTAVDAPITMTPKAKSVIVVFLTGGASHHETFDPKPDAPAEIRGEFGTIQTSVPGLIISEHLPLLAQRIHMGTLVRSLAHTEENHLLATHQVLTGMAIPGGKFDQIASRNDWPCYAAGVDYFRPRHDGVPTGVTLPTFLMEGPLVWPGQHAGILGPKFDPWHIRNDPSDRKFRVEAVKLEDGIERLNERRDLLDQLVSKQPPMTSDIAAKSLQEQQEKAFSILSAGKVGESFELEREPLHVRERYGRQRYGQSLLMARRLVEAGVRLVQVNMGHVQNWDSHGGIFNRLKNDLLPPLDRGVSALLDDLDARGLLSETMVVVFGEFGRTPKINKEGGRDHWGRAFFSFFAGGGVQRGQLIGKTDSAGAAPITNPYSPMDLGATIYRSLGVNHDSEIYDKLKRPVKLNTGKPMDAIW
jgi:hypothetical protein